MSEPHSTSLQDILKRRQQDEFVGREEQRTFFQTNLGYTPDDSRRRFVINISGQGGVGKTWLLRRFREIAEEAGVVTACTDQNEHDLPGVMGHIAEQFEVQGHPLKAFAKRYKVYRQRKEEIEADPKAPQGFPAFLGRTLAKVSLHLVHQVPVGGAVADFVDKEAFASLGEDFAAYVARKVGNKDEVHLVLEPVEVLTPLFLADLRKVAEVHSLALFFDTYERTGDFLDAWLRDLLEDRHGKVPTNIVLTIVGQDELDRNNWISYGGLLARLPLEPFTDGEARDYLARKQVTDEQVVEVILHLSGRLPLLVATLAAESPDDPAKVGDPSGEAVERFLKWVEDPEQRQVALDAALPRWLNRDVVAVLVGEKANTLFAWLRDMPFVEKRGEGWVYHGVVREQMLRYKRQETPQGWADLHGRLAGYYEGLRDGLGLEEEAGRKDEIWPEYPLEVLYHSLCQAPHKYLSKALNGFLAALKAEFMLAIYWAATMYQAGKDTKAKEVEGWGKQLAEGLIAYVGDHYQTTVEMFTALLKCSGVEDQWRPFVRRWRGETYENMERYDEALADFNRAIELDPEDAQTIANRGITYVAMERYNDALTDLSHAIEIEPDNAIMTARRGVFYQLMKQYDDALADLNRAIELQPDNVPMIAIRGETYRLMKEYERALADLDQAVELEPDNASPIAGRGETYRLMEQYEKALVDFNQAIELKPDYAWAIANRGLTYRDMELYNDALANLNQAIELQPDNASIIANRGETYQLIGRYDDALADLNRAVELQPDNASIIAARGDIYRLLEGYDSALADFNQAIELEPDYAWAIARRGEIYRSMGRYDDALADSSRAIELEPRNAWAIASRGETYRLMERYDDALADFNQAIELEPDYAWAIARRGEIYRSMGRYDDALADSSRAIELEPRNAWAIASRGETYRLMEQYDNALTDFNCAIELDKDYAWAIVRRGITYQETEQYDDAMVDFSRAIELDPGDAWAIGNRGETYRLMEQHEKALADFNRAIELKPDYTWAILSRAYTYQLMELYDDALADLNQTIELLPNNALMIADRGEIYGLMGQYDKALADFNRAIELKPGHTWAIAGRGKTYRLMEQYDNALADFNRAIELEPEDDWCLYDRALTYQAMGQTGKAQGDLITAIQQARKKYEIDTRDWTNTLNLALYHLAAGEAKKVEHLYGEALSTGAPAHRVRDAIRDLKDFLALFPDHPQARQMHSLLQDYLHSTPAERKDQR